MTIRSILAPLTGYEESPAALAAGLRIACRLHSFIDVVCVRPDPRDAVSLATGSAKGAGLDPLVAHVEKEAETRSKRAHEIFELASRQAGTDTPGACAMASFRLLTGRMARDVPIHGRTYDLILFGRLLDPDATEWRLTLETTLVASGRPVLLLPADARLLIGEIVAVAWNGSAEAARAASAALPILRQARRVLLLTGARDAPVVPGLLEVGEWLERHGIFAERKAVPLEEWPVGEKLVAEAARAGADLLVMGAYGHDRARATIFGGATRAVLNESTLPVLLAH